MTHMPRTGWCLGSGDVDLLIFMLPDEPDNFIVSVTGKEQWMLFTLTFAMI